mmetsp:Transcript_21013/g.42903  ORF Transcript_21013/g.42903 Transcript_21013/m.42903 type:complete len:210 (-) Transcript_21013:1412-2041(-)
MLHRNPHSMCLQQLQRLHVVVAQSDLHGAGRTDNVSLRQRAGVQRPMVQDGIDRDVPLGPRSGLQRQPDRSGANRNGVLHPQDRGVHGGQVQGRSGLLVAVRRVAVVDLLRGSQRHVPPDTRHARSNLRPVRSSSSSLVRCRVQRAQGCCAGHRYQRQHGRLRTNGTSAGGCDYHCGNADRGRPGCHCSLFHQCLHARWRDQTDPCNQG